MNYRHATISSQKAVAYSVAKDIACDLVDLCFVSSVLLEIIDILHFDIGKVPHCKGFTFGAGERFLMSLEPLLEVIKSITPRDIPSYYFVFLPCKG
jgi:hypothetical protein